MPVDKIKEEVVEEGKKITREARERTLGYIEAGLGIIAGLAWNDAVKALIEYLFPLSKNTLFAKFVYAGLMTFIVVAVTVYLARILKRNGEGAGGT